MDLVSRPRSAVSTLLLYVKDPACKSASSSMDQIYALGLAETFPGSSTNCWEKTCSASMTASLLKDINRRHRYAFHI